MSQSTAEERVLELEARHRQLHEEVQRLERRVIPTPEEQRVMAELKRQKLAAKDELYLLRRAVS